MSRHLAGRAWGLLDFHSSAAPNPPQLCPTPRHARQLLAAAPGSGHGRRRRRGAAAGWRRRRRRAA
eukprot:357-Chlamydomonas_euryale.AAC.1